MSRIQELEQQVLKIAEETANHYVGAYGD